MTGGNFVELVKRGFYDNMDIQRSDGFVVQTGDPKGEADGYVASPSKSVGAGKHGERLIPLEIFAKGDKGPFYESGIEDEGRGGRGDGVAVLELRRDGMGEGGVRRQLGEQPILLAPVRLGSDPRGEERVGRTLSLLRVRRRGGGFPPRHQGGRRHRVREGHVGGGEPCLAQQLDSIFWAIVTEENSLAFLIIKWCLPSPENSFGPLLCSGP